MKQWLLSICSAVVGWLLRHYFWQTPVTALVRSQQFEAKLVELAKTGGESRSPKWAGVRKAFLAKPGNDHCKGCGGTKMLEAHHKKPFHLEPALELDESNLITLCEAPGHDCHFHFGHDLDWKAYNPDVVADAAQFLNRVQERKYS